MLESGRVNDIVVPIIVGLVLTVPSFAIGYWGLRRSQKIDKVTASTEAVTQIINGLNVLVDNVTSQRDYWRGQAVEADALRKQVAELQVKLEACMAENVALVREQGKG